MVDDFCAMPVCRLPIQLASVLAASAHGPIECRSLDAAQHANSAASSGEQAPDATCTRARSAALSPAGGGSTDPRPGLDPEAGYLADHDLWSLAHNPAAGRENLSRTAILYKIDSELETGKADRSQPPFGL